MILCLDKCNAAEALCSICETFFKLIENTHSLIEEHISDLLPRFLKLSTFKPSMVFIYLQTMKEHYFCFFLQKVRTAALKCLKAFTKGAYPIYKLLPHKQNVIFELAASLDDPKRLVRKEAVETRSRWFLLDAPI